ncbi:MAG TPA: ABC transporter ATP-binding protein [Rhizomicrobium sp.]|nr:ABC transporter ATP-binding protein [Rhizomicrobium sp.]
MTTAQHGFAYKLLKLMVPKERRALTVLLGLTVIGTLLETLSVGLIIPALAFMTSNNVAGKYPFIKPFLRSIGNPDQVHLIVYGMLAFVLGYAVKTSFMLFLAWRQGQFLFGLHAGLSQRLFSSYLRQPYTFHLQRNSAQLVRNITVEINAFTNAAQASVSILTECSVLFGITLLLFAVEPLGMAIVCAATSLAAWGFQKSLRARILNWGRQRQYHEGLRLQHVQQGLGSVKDIKLLGREEAFLDSYILHSLGTSTVQKRQFFVQQMPRLWLELLSVIALALVIFAMLANGVPVSGLLPVVGLFGAAAFRMLPSVNRSMVALQQARFAFPVIELLYQELCELAPPPFAHSDRQMPFSRAITVEHLHFQYEKAGSPALSDINLTIPHGTSVGFVGGSGAGKSTLIDVILGLLPASSGRVCVDGIDIRGDLRAWQNCIGYVPQSIFLTDDSLRRNIALGLKDAEIDEVRIQRALRQARLEEFVASLPEGLETMVGERGVRLSGGQRQRIGIARALYHGPEVLVLDEATSALDNDTEKGVMEAIDAMHGQKTILIIAHRLSTIAGCDKLVRLQHGQLMAEPGTTALDGASEQ